MICCHVAMYQNHMASTTIYSKLTLRVLIWFHVGFQKRPQAGPKYLLPKPAPGTFIPVTQLRPDRCWCGRLRILGMFCLRVVVHKPGGWGGRGASRMTRPADVPLRASGISLRVARTPRTFECLDWFGGLNYRTTSFEAKWGICWGFFRVAEGFNSLFVSGGCSLLYG